MHLEFNNRLYLPFFSFSLSLCTSLCFSISLIHLDSGFCLIPWTHARELSFSISRQTLKVFYCLYAECLWLRTVWHIKQTQKYSNSTNAQKSAIERHITPSSIYIGSDVLQSSALFFLYSLRFNVIKIMYVICMLFAVGWKSAMNISMAFLCWDKQKIMEI